MDENITLTEKEKKAVIETSKKLNLHTPLQFGAAAQKDFMLFAKALLQDAKIIELGELEASLTSLRDMLLVTSKQKAKKCFFQALLPKSDNNEQMQREAQDKMSALVDTVSAQMERLQLMLRKDSEILDQLFEKNQNYYKMLTLYMQAGKLRLGRERETTIANMREIARRTELAVDLQAVKDYEELCNTFMHRLRELDALRTACSRFGQEIRVLQESNTVLSDTMHEVLLTAIPLWKENGMQEAGNEKLQRALESVRHSYDKYQQMRQGTERKMQMILSEEQNNV